jgi:hypothetical protein
VVKRRSRRLVVVASLVCGASACAGVWGFDDLKVGDGGAGDGGTANSVDVGASDDAMRIDARDAENDAYVEATPSLDAVAATDVVAIACQQPEPTNDAGWPSDPAAELESPTPAGYILRKSLTGDPNYSADVMYTGQTDAWIFDIPSGGRMILSATVIVYALADNTTYDPDKTQYSFDLWSNGCTYDNTLPLPAASPFDPPFVNWVQMGPYPASITAGGSYSVAIQNTSAAGSANWIAVQTVELHVTTM